MIDVDELAIEKPEWVQVPPVPCGFTARRDALPTNTVVGDEIWVKIDDRLFLMECIEMTGDTVTFREMCF